MNFWGISLVVCGLVADIFVGEHVYTQHHPVYTVSTTSNVTVVSWQNHTIYKGKPSTVTVSPDVQSVAWVVDHLAGHIKVDGAGDPVYAGTLYMAHAGGQPVEIKKLSSSRGFTFPDEDPDIGVVYHPEKLKWDSTSQYLYFTTMPWVSRLMLWQIQPGATVPHAIVPLWDYRLKKWHGADWLEAYETNYAPPPVCRDWTATSIYSPDAITSDKPMEPVRTGSVKTWGK